MSLTIHPDPQEPAGGFAFLELPSGALGGGPVMVAVFEVYGARWLGPSDEGSGRVAIGDGNWQGERHDFGPYEVHDFDGADWVRIGPEIVNKIEEYTPLRMAVGTLNQDVTWPDDVPPRAGAAVLGGLQSTALAGAQDQGAALVGKAPQPKAPPEPEPEPLPDPEPVEAEVETEEDAPKRMIWWLLLLLILLLAALAAAWWFYWRTPVVDPSEPAPDQSAAPENPSQDKTVLSPDETCTKRSISGLEGFDAQQLAIRTCGASLSADTVLELIEDAANAEDKDALLLFGTLYDGATLDDEIETVIGLSFADNAARAAEYYARAKAAGSDEATQKLSATCTVLEQASETLAKGAFDDFCE